MEIIETFGNTVLLEEFLARKKRNSSYSLRQFALFLGVSPTYLSLILSGQRKVPSKTADKFGKKLSLSPSQIRKMHAKGDFSQSEGSKEILNEDIFKVIADWKHFAVLSLGDLKDNKADAKWISRRLGISEMEARDAFGRLKKLNFIEVVGSKFKQCCDNFKTTDDIPSSAIRQFHSGLLDLIKEKMETIPVQSREMQSLVFSGNSKKVKYAKELIRKFQVEMENELGAGELDTVFSFSMQLMPLTQDMTKERL
jgi:uncharacterized protein (TIGR02147 family)